jgi:RNA polymerase sigma-70 factor (ECF subfamily)
MDEKEIIQKIVDGEKELFSKVLDKYQRQILAYTARLLNFHQQDAQDATSQAFLKCYINLAGYNPKLKFSSWLYRIAHNEAVSIIRKKSKTSTRDLEGVEISTDFEDEKVNKEALEKILGHLKLEEKNLLVLFYLEEKSIREIAEILKTSEGSVKTRLSRTRKKAKEIVNIKFKPKYA